MEELIFFKQFLSFPNPSFKKEAINSIYRAFKSSNLNARENELVCVTSANSFLASHLIKKLLADGYLVRVTIQHPGFIFFSFIFLEILQFLCFFFIYNLFIWAMNSGF